MLEFEITADICKAGEFYSKKRTMKVLRAENKLCALMEHRKFHRKKGEEVYVVVDVKAFRIKYDKTRVPLSEDELWELERQRELDAKLTRR